MKTYENHLSSYHFMYDRNAIPAKFISSEEENNTSESDVTEGDNNSDMDTEMPSNAHVSDQPCASIDEITEPFEHERKHVAITGKKL